MHHDFIVFILIVLETFLTNDIGTFCFRYLFLRDAKLDINLLVHITLITFIEHTFFRPIINLENHNLLMITIYVYVHCTPWQIIFCFIKYCYYYILYIYVCHNIHLI